MAEPFDPYYQWLGIPPKDQPPHRYRLLGIDLFEANPNVIENAAYQRMAHVRTFQIGQHAEWSQKLLNEFAAAKICLLNPEKKAAYDRSLQQQLASPGLEDNPPPRQVLRPPVLPPSSVPPVALPVSPPVATGAPVPVTVGSSELLSSRVGRRRSSSWQGALGMAGVVVGCGVALVVLWSQDGSQQRHRTAKQRRPVIVEKSASNVSQAAKPQRSSVALDSQGGEGEPSSDSQSLPSIKPETNPPTLVTSGSEMALVAEEPAEPQEDKPLLPSRSEKETESAAISSSLPANKPPEVAAQEKLQASLARGLKWLAANQQEDGGWSFQTGPNPGRDRNAMGATALALLPFLRVDSTHQTGEYKEPVRRGLEYLCTRGQIGPHGLDLRGGNLAQGMYTHGLATIVLCQAYLQSKDRKLRNPAQLAVNFIVEAQDPKGGGWRYRPHQPGDTSVLGWQMTALTIAREAKLKVPQTAFAGATVYLNSVQSENGRIYGYDRPGNGSPAMTAIGLLARTCLGWDRDTPALCDGVQSIVVQGLSEDVYFNFYATRLLAIWGHATESSPDERPEWKTWKEQMRAHILDSQERFGNAQGSWFMGKGLVNESAGRLGVTSLTLIILAAVAPD